MVEFRKYAILGEKKETKIFHNVKSDVRLKCINSEKLFKETSNMLTNEQFTCLAETYIDTVFRVAFNYLKSSADAEDVTQNVFLKLMKERRPFESESHVKHWLIRVTVNECKNLTRSKWWRMESFEDYAATLTFDQPERKYLW